ncbi:MAG: type I glyceraldehyde-3-phosphate dehydrogenase [Deltaproteobacteria bacterium]|nr:type I glyceraldehyde-3-phosphate dehydrogenase [Deltaproteobacteria bacterium]
MADELKVGINGFGRIGRLVARAMLEQGGFRIVAINDLINPDDYARGVHFMGKLFQFDSTHGRYAGTVSTDERRIIVDGNPIEVLSHRVPEEIPWDRFGVDYVIESTGVFRKRDQVAGHLASQGVKKVLLTVPPKDPVDALIVLGVNDGDLKAEHRIISNASCTTNCLAPIVKVLNDCFGLVRGFMTTVHAYTGDQKLLDVVHKSDLRRARSAAANIIPTTTGAARTIGKIIPELEGRLDGMAIRVPVHDGSIVDFVCELERIQVRKPAEMKEEINSVVREAAEGPMAGILQFSDDALVSSDIVHNPHSSIFDSLSTMTMANSRLVKVVTWYDNEWGYSNRCVDLLRKAASL